MPPSPFDATVKGIPVFGTASLFAGRRSNEDLGRSVTLDAGLLPLSRGAPMTADVRRPPRRGTTSAGATKRRQPSSMENPSSIGDASFTRSFDPFTSTSWQHRGRKPTMVRRSRRHRGRASLRKREKPTPGSSGTDVARLAAYHRFRKGAAWCVRKGRRSWPPSLRGSTSSGLVARTSYAVAEVVRRRVVPNKLDSRAPKRAAASSEQGPSSERRSAGHTVGKRVERRRRRGSSSPGNG